MHDIVWFFNPPSNTHTVITLEVAMGSYKQFSAPFVGVIQPNVYYLNFETLTKSNLYNFD